jgi:hypothetical protein
MTAWSRSEASRTIEEVKRRSAIDPEFRALALSDPLAALNKINPRPVPAGSVRFIEATEQGQEIDDSLIIVAVLPDPIPASEELELEELENVAGGGSGSTLPPVGAS